MKKLAIALCLTATVLTAMGQGTVQFNNRLTAVGINAPVTYMGAGVEGPAFVGQLFVDNGGSYEPIGTPVDFRTGVAAGYVNGGEVAIASIAPGNSATLVLRAWNSAAGSDWSTASSSPAGIVGESNPVTVSLGGEIPGAPPAPAANLVGLQAFSLVAVPEPSTIALGVLGLAALALRRRK